MATPSDAMRIYTECRQDIDIFSWPLAIHEFGMYHLPFISDFWQPCTGFPAVSCEICSKDMTSDRNPQALITCGHVFCGKCIDKWFQNHSTPQCPTCSVYIDEADDPQYCIACCSIQCYCEYDILCPICHYTHYNMSECIRQYNEEVYNSLYHFTPRILERIEEGDETHSDSDDETTYRMIDTLHYLDSSCETV